MGRGISHGKNMRIISFPGLPRFLTYLFSQNGTIRRKWRGWAERQFPIQNLLDRVVTPSLRGLFESDTHAGSRRKGDKHFEAKSLPFASGQV
jgi:hypothetical protein